uniref:Solute carrier organic anion transporter family member 6A1 n=1 Tax=Phocoena sinus TaxID=42100 RepID=A0A8C9B0D2_PHOSS
IFVPGKVHSMQEALVEVEPRAALAQPAENTVPSEADAGKARGKNPLFRIFPANLIKFGSFKKRERDQAGSTPPSIKKVREKQEESLEGPCGLGCMTFPRCQRFNNIRCFLIFFCILVISQCIVFGLVDLSTDNFQKENHLKTAENLVLSLTYDISSCLVVVFIAYYGGKGNILGWITVSSFLVGSGSLLFAFPYFSGGNYKMTVETEGLVEAAGILGYALGYAIGAPLIKASVNSTFETRTGQLGNLTAPCNSHCKCSSSFYSATCGRNDIRYFSPCFAGCTYSKTLKNHKTYYNCSCIKEGLTTSDNQGDFIDARHGTCDSKCYKLPLFIAFIFSTIVFCAFADIPNILTILRIVSDKQRSLAMGVTFVILRIFGTIPGPVIFKIVGETSCILRDTERCGSIGSCWIYNKTKMAYLLAGYNCFTMLYIYIYPDISSLLRLPPSHPPYPTPLGGHKARS